jgi:soluble P-type ATPase
VTDLEFMRRLRDSGLISDHDAERLDECIATYGDLLKSLKGLLDNVRDYASFRVVVEARESIKRAEGGAET